MRTYTLKEVSNIIHVPTSKIKQWEKELAGILEIPRSKQGSRLYTNLKIHQLDEIKQLYHGNLSSEEIRNILQEKLNQSPEQMVENSDTLETAAADSLPKEITAISTDNFFIAMDQYKHTFLNEIKSEIKKVVQTEVMDEIKKEISKGSLTAVKNISDSIYKSSANTIEEIKELSFTIQKTSQITAETYKSLDKRIADQTLETSEEFYSISKQLSETSGELAHYIDVTNNEITCLTETLVKEREYFIEDRDQFRHEIRQRELVFQTMLSSFRDAAPTRGKKWWRFW